MAGDWIKMRSNLWDHPKVARIVDMTDSTEATVIGALYWLWSTADQHTEDGTLHGLTCKGIDRKTGVPGFAQALCAIGWLADHPEGVRVVDFEEHNGTSAKKRCQTAKRVANFGAANAKPTQDPEPTNAHSVSSALAREEKRREEEEKKGGESASASAPVPRQQSPDGSPPPFLPEFKKFIETERPDLDAAVTFANFSEHFPPEKHTPANWRKWVRREHPGLVGQPGTSGPPTVADPDSRASVEALGVSLGLGKWAQLNEHWAPYAARVKAMASQGVAA